MSRLLFQKTGRAKYISHLDLMRTFQRAFQRADLTIKHTEGFNPHPFISIVLPLSLGYSSDCEILDFQLLDNSAMDDVPVRLNRVLPEGITVLRCYEGGQKAKYLTHVEYQITFEIENEFCPALMSALQELLSREKLEIVKKSKKAKTGETIVDIIPLVKSFSMTAKSDGVELHVILCAQNPSLNPTLLVKALEQEYPDLPIQFVRYHRCAVLDQAGAVFV